MVFFQKNMKKSALLALMVAILLPLIGYLIVKHYGENAVIVPKRYFAEDVVPSADGKSMDTIWHKVKNMQFTNQLGKQVQLDDIKTKTIVVNYFFTRCPTICPKLTKSMKRLQDSFGDNPEVVHFISISVDPVHDSVENLRAFADKYDVNHDNWWFVTGDKKEIYDFAIQEMKANIADPGIDTAFIHTEDFFLLDSTRVIRGWYSGFSDEDQHRLVRDIPTLMLEKDKSKPSILNRFVPILPIIFFSIGFVIVVMLILNKRKKK